MMVLIYWILLAGAVFILGAMFVLLMYEPKPPAPETKEAVPYKPAENPDADALWQSVILKRPDIMIGFERHTLQHGILLRWSGLAKEGDAYLFDTVHENTGELVLRASERMMQENIIPSRPYWILMPLSANCHTEAVLEACRLLRSLDVKIGLVIEEYPSFDSFFNDERETSLICAGHKAMMEIIADGINTDFPLRDSEFAKGAYEKIAEELPMAVRMQMRLFKKKGMRSLVKLVPKTAGWYRTTVSRDGTRYILHSAEASIPQKDLSVLRNSIKDLRVIRENHASVYLDPRGEIYTAVEKTALSLYPDRPCIPVLSDEPEIYRGFRTVGFSPVSSPADPISDAAVRFYQDILK